MIHRIVISLAVPSESLEARTDDSTARVETALRKRTFGEAAHSHRAIIPASGYYEWDRRKQPHYFHDDERPTLLLAGLYNWWRAGAEAGGDSP